MSHRSVLVLAVPIASLCLFAQDAAIQINNGSLPQAQQGNIYAEAFHATGGTSPYHWKISAGVPPPGLAMNSNGDFVGTPAGIGAFNFTVMVTDAESNVATNSFGMTVAAATGFDGPARLPIANVPSSMVDTPATGSIIHVAAGDDLQAALNTVQCGDTIALQAGATFTGTFRFPALSCDDRHWIVVRSSAPIGALPGEGHRLTPCYAGIASLPGRPQYPCNNPRNVLAKLVAASIMGPVIFRNGANHYRLIGLELVRMASATKSAVTLMSVEPGGTANHIVLDRSWLHGTAQDETRGGFNLSGTNHVAVVDSYFSDFHCVAVTGACMEAHALGGGSGNYQDGPYKIEDNFLEASGQAILFGGGPANATPSDITIRFNHFFKPWMWMKGNTPFQGGASGHPFIVRHALELKNATRVLIENNLIENVWGGFGESGYAVLLNAKNQHVASGGDVCPSCEVTDVTIRYPRISHASGGIQMETALSGNGRDGAPAETGARYSIHDVVMDDISRRYNGGGRLFTVANEWPANPLNSISINHVTGFPDPDGGILFVGNLLSNPEMYGFVFTNSIVKAGKYPVWNQSGGSASCGNSNMPLTSLSNCFSSYTFTTNALIAAPPYDSASSWPTGNLFEPAMNQVGFLRSASGNGGNYQLSWNSPFKNKGTDGKDLGADVVGLNQALKGVE